jgi:protein arginine N-methyltransferase 1
MCIWFETQLMEGVGYSSGPGGQSTIYGQAFLPWLEPVNLKEGQKIGVCLHADLVEDDYVWRWETRIDANDNNTALNFQQSTLQGLNLGPHTLRRRASDYIPKLSEDAQAECAILQAMDGIRSLQEIADMIYGQFPGLFGKWENAFHSVAELSAKFSR